MKKNNRDHLSDARIGGTYALPECSGISSRVNRAHVQMSYRWFSLFKICAVSVCFVGKKIAGCPELKDICLKNLRYFFTKCPSIHRNIFLPDTPVYSERYPSTSILREIFDDQILYTSILRDICPPVCHCLCEHHNTKSKNTLRPNTPFIEENQKATQSYHEVTSHEVTSRHVSYEVIFCLP